MGKIVIENIRIYAYHGCMEEEAKIGSDYLVDLMVKTDLSASAQSDDLNDTVDYVHLFQIVKEEMAVRSKLLEHVAQRILDRIPKEISHVKQTKIKLSKCSPPMGGDVEKVSVVMKG